ncbi:MAG: CDP-diacylglycerol--serine O-phosphatidyltransferase [Holosporaceae bacterium]|jgi:CDP-diacylglycerol--serine O-phosphatidyltransferase|nr:CDP-diacylglycerol--serine O-phosphatidyltransferase [Holosporaceae bacterium]
MDIIETENIQQKKKVPFARIFPTVITIAAFCFGMTSIRFALSHRWEMAVVCVFISALLDSFDGRVARMLGQSSQFGAELDSLSDLVCFGVAPALLLFFRSVYALGNVGWGICMFFTVCCALRLARFNAVQILNEPKPEWQKKYFTGIPAPAGAIIALFPLILHFSTGKTCFLNEKIVTICLFISGVLMISTVKSMSSKMIEIKNGFASQELLLISFLIICLITELWLTLTVLIALYIITIPYGIYKYAKTAKEESVVFKQVS